MRHDCDKGAGGILFALGNRILKVEDQGIVITAAGLGKLALAIAAHESGSNLAFGTFAHHRHALAARDQCAVLFETAVLEFDQAAIGF